MSYPLYISLVNLFTGALCIGVTSKSVYKLREMVTKEVFQMLLCLDVIS